MRVLIVGCGRVGGLLAGNLSGEDTTFRWWMVTLVPSAGCRSDFRGEWCLAPVSTRTCCELPGVEQADVFVAVTHDDNTNIMAAQIARKVFHIERVVLAHLRPGTCRCLSPAWIDGHLSDDNGRWDDRRRGIEVQRRRCSGCRKFLESIRCTSSWSAAAKSATTSRRR